ncbi:MAG TPA: S8 family serine peptidase [Streptosporangiaceae bacterium]|nr:S8 family serine peptidase [Streptosporangiaceae bacterium]
MTVLSAVAATFGLAAMPVMASASPVRPAASTASVSGKVGPMGAGPQHGDTRQVCKAAKPGYMSCMAIVKLASAAPNAHAAVVNPSIGSVPYGPADLRSAYGLATAAATKGGGRTVAIVDAFNDPRAASDLATYRSHYGLPPCTKANGCLHILNEHGNTSPLPSNSFGWTEEISLDLDMVSAICPKCHITLIEANSARTKSMGIAEDTAASRSSFISNSWGSAEFPTESGFNKYFNHPHHAIVFAAGDNGHSTPSYPGAYKDVISVGGTKLVHQTSGSRAWTETVWGTKSNSNHQGTQSGCSKYLIKPSWQHHSRFTCPRRTQNDVAAVGDPDTGVAIVDTYKTGGTWWQFGGTSAATPIITAAIALAGRPTAKYPASKIYAHPGKFHDVTRGQNGTCSRWYVCHARAGYDGPTGIGTPKGLGGL